MRKASMILAGLAAVLVLVLVLRGGGSAPPAPPAPPAPQAAPAPAPGAPPHPPVEDAGGMSTHPGMVDEFTRLVLTYPLTMARLEAYTAAVHELRLAGQKDPALMARLRTPRPPDEVPAGMAARLEAIGPLKAILDRHGLVGMDLVVIPQAVYSGRNAFALEQEQRPIPADQHNVAAAALYRADLPKVDAIVKAYMADLKAIDGR